MEKAFCLCLRPDSWKNWLIAISNCRGKDFLVTIEDRFRWNDSRLPIALRHSINTVFTESHICAGDQKRISEAMCESCRLCLLRLVEWLPEKRVSNHRLSKLLGLVAILVFYVEHHPYPWTPHQLDSFVKQLFETMTWELLPDFGFERKNRLNMSLPACRACLDFDVWNYLLELIKRHNKMEVLSIKELDAEEELKKKKRDGKKAKKAKKRQRAASTLDKEDLDLIAGAGEDAITTEKRRKISTSKEKLAEYDEKEKAGKNALIDNKPGEFNYIAANYNEKSDSDYKPKKFEIPKKLDLEKPHDEEKKPKKSPKELRDRLARLLFATDSNDDDEDYKEGDSFDGSMDFNEEPEHEEDDIVLGNGKVEYPEDIESSDDGVSESVSLVEETDEDF